MKAHYIKYQGKIYPFHMLKEFLLAKQQKLSNKSLRLPLKSRAYIHLAVYLKEITEFSLAKYQFYLLEQDIRDAATKFRIAKVLIRWERVYGHKYLMIKPTVFPLPF